MNKILALCTVLAMVAAAVPGTAATETKTFRYLAPTGDIISIWCAAGGHNYAPIGPNPNPTPVGDFLGWLFSGEPECTVGDALTADPNESCGDHLLCGDETAFGGGAFLVNNHLGGQAVVTVIDDLTTTNMPFALTVGDLFYDPACGTNSVLVDIPATTSDHWQGGGLKLMWVFVGALEVDETTSAVCAASQGTVTGVLD